MIPKLLANPELRRFSLKLLVVGAALSLFSQLEELALESADKRYEAQLLANAEHELAAHPAPVEVLDHQAIADRYAARVIDPEPLAEAAPASALEAEL